jgi:hypothetical protein
MLKLSEMITQGVCLFTANFPSELMSSFLSALFLVILVNHQNIFLFLLTISYRTSLFAHSTQQLVIA